MVLFVYQFIFIYLFIESFMGVLIVIWLLHSRRDGEGKDSDEAYREHNKQAGDILKEEKWHRLLK